MSDSRTISAMAMPTTTSFPFFWGWGEGFQPGTANVAPCAATVLSPSPGRSPVSGD